MIKLEFQQEIIKGRSEFKNEKFDDLEISSIIQFQKKALKFICCEFNFFKISLFTEIATENIEFKSCIFKSDVEIYIDTSINLKFFKSLVFKSNVSFRGDVSGGNFSFIESKIIKGQLSFVDINNSNNLMLNNCVIDSIKFQNIKFDKVILGGKRQFIKRSEFHNVEINLLFIFDGFFNYLTIRDSSINFLNIQGSTSELNLSNFLINEIILNSNKFQKSIISNFICRVNFELYNNDFDKCSLHNIEFLNYFESVNQYFDNLILNALDFSNAKLSFKGSNLTSTVATNIVWPKNHLLFPDYFCILDLKQLRSLSEQYRQLKLLSEKSGNKLSSLKFYNHEMKTNLKVSLLDKNLDFWDRLLLSTNKYFSNFGLSYTRRL